MGDIASPGEKQRFNLERENNLGEEKIGPSNHQNDAQPKTPNASLGRRAKKLESFMGPESPELQRHEYCQDQCQETGADCYEGANLACRASDFGML
jgi:hypothetical protein